MPATLLDPPDVLRRPSYVARLTTYDGKEIEKALSMGAQFSLVGSAPTLDGALVEATYAAGRPPLLKRLGETRIPRLLEPESLRFTGANFLQTAKLRALPYAPSRRLTSFNFERTDARTLAEGSLDFAQHVGADLYIAPGLPLRDDELGRWRDHNERVLERSAQANGSTNIERRPLMALVAPGTKALRDPEATISRLLDYPVSGVYLQPLRLLPRAVGVETLARFVQFALAIQSAGLPVMVARVGAFGLVLQALGVQAFDSGLGSAENNDLASLTRARSEREDDEPGDEDEDETSSRKGRQSRTYLEALMTTAPTKVATALLERPGLVGDLLCDRGCCRFHPRETLADRARQHFLHVRREEVAGLRALESGAARLHEIEQRLRKARDRALRVRRVAGDVPGLPRFDHLDTWLGLLAREHAAGASSK